MTGSKFAPATPENYPLTVYVEIEPFVVVDRFDNYVVERKPNGLSVYMTYKTRSRAMQAAKRARDGGIVDAWVLDRRTVPVCSQGTGRINCDCCERPVVQ